MVRVAASSQQPNLPLPPLHHQQRAGIRGLVEADLGQSLGRILFVRDPLCPPLTASPLPLPAASGSEPVRDIRCEFCGEYFENRKGLSSHARSHLRQMGVTEWSVNGSPIDTLREILKRRAQPRGAAPNPAGPGQKAMAKSLLGAMGPLEPRGPGELHIPGLAKKVQQAGSPLGQSPTSSPPPTARKMFPGLSPPSLQKKLKQDQLRVEIKREMMSGGLHGDPHPSDRAWSPREEMSPLNLCKCPALAFPSFGGARWDRAALVLGLWGLKCEAEGAGGCSGQAEGSGETS